MLSSDDDKVPQNETDSTHKKVAETSASGDSGDSAHFESASSGSVDDVNYKEVTQAVYDAHISKMKEITERINQYESLLRLSAQLPDKGQKLKQFVVNLSAEFGEMQTTLKILRVKEPSQLALDFQNLSINESHDTSQTPAELSYGDNDAIGNLFQEIKNSEKTMPSVKDFADQPRLIKGQLMPHQRHALAWMIWREDQYPKGGILGDDMGLGKTLTTIALIARHIEMKNSSKNKDEDADKSGWCSRIGDIGWIEVLFCFWFPFQPLQVEHWLCVLLVSLDNGRTR